MSRFSSDIHNFFYFSGKIFTSSLLSPPFLSNVSLEAQPLFRSDLGHSGRRCSSTGTGSVRVSSFSFFLVHGRSFIFSFRSFAGLSGGACLLSSFPVCPGGGFAAVVMHVRIFRGRDPVLRFVLTAQSQSLPCDLLEFWLFDRWWRGKQWVVMVGRDCWCLNCWDRWVSSCSRTMVGLEMDLWQRLDCIPKSLLGINTILAGYKLSK